MLVYDKIKLEKKIVRYTNDKKVIIIFFSIKDEILYRLTNFEIKTQFVVEKQRKTNLGSEVNLMID